LNTAADASGSNPPRRRAAFFASACLVREITVARSFVAAYNPPANPANHDIVKPLCNRAEGGARAAQQ